MNRPFAAALFSLLVLSLAASALHPPGSRAAAPPSPALDATCFCRITANGIDVDKKSKGGYIQGLQKGKCQDYCRGVWDASSEQQRSEWARRPAGLCGNVTVRMEAAIGTAGYEAVRSATMHVGPGPNPCPHGGSYDGANCLIASPPPASQPFIHHNNFYYKAVSNNPATRCPLGWWDGANCQVSKNPAEAIPFIYEGRFYIVSACEDKDKWTGWQSDSNTLGSLYARAKHRKVELKWELHNVTVTVPGQTLGGSNTITVESIKVCRKEGALGNPCNHETTVISGWQPGTIVSDLKSNQVYRFRVLIRKTTGGEFFAGEAVNVTTK